MAKLTVEVDGLDRTIQEMKRDLHRGMERSADNISSLGEGKGREVLELHDRIFNRDVFRKFKTIEVANEPGHVRVKLLNHSDHAGAVEWGVSPAQYTDGGPPVQALLPWVARKMTGNYKSGSGGSNDGGGGGSDDGDSSDSWLPWRNDYTGGNNRPTRRKGEKFEPVEEKPENFKPYDILRVGSSYRRGSVKIVESVDDEKIEFQGSSNPFYFGDRAKGSNVIGGKHHIGNLNELNQDDQIIVNGSRTGPDAWDGHYVYVVIDEIIEYPDGQKEIIGHDLSGGWSGVTITVESIQTARKFRSSSWDIRDQGQGQRVEFWNSDTGRIETGWIEDKDSTDKRWQANKEITIRTDAEYGYRRHETSADTILDIKSQNRKNISKAEVPDHDHFDHPDISPASQTDFERGKRFLLWHKQDKEFINGIAYRGYTSGKHFTVENDLMSKVIASSDSTSEDGMNDVEIVGKYNDVRGMDNNIPLSENDDNELFYGQQVTIERDGETDTAVVSDWDYDTVYLAETDLAETAERRPNAMVEARITEVQDWNDLNVEEQREQVRNEVKYRLSTAYLNEEFPDVAADFFAEDWFDSFKDKEYIRETLTHADFLTDNASPMTAGSVSTSYWNEKYYDIRIRSDYKNGEYDGLLDETAHHEMGHATFLRHSIDHSGYDLANNYADSFPENLGFLEDGTVDTSLLDSDDLQHGPIENYVMHDRETGERFTDTDFTDVEPFDGFSDITDPESIEWDTSVSDSDLFDPVNPDLEVGDIVHYETGYDREHILVFTGSSTSSTTEPLWSFRDIDNSRGKRLKTDENGELKRGGQILGHKPASVDVSRDELTSSYDDPLKDIASVSSQSMKQQLWTMQHDSTDENLNSEADNILRPYTAMNTHETVAGLLSIFQSDNYAKVQELRNVKKMYPGLLKSYLQLYNPGETAVEYLEQFDDLEEYL